MRNITVSVDDATYRAARRAAADRDSSMSALVREFLAGLKDPSRRRRSDAKSWRKVWKAIDQSRSEVGERPTRQRTYDR